MGVSHGVASHLFGFTMDHALELDTLELPGNGHFGNYSYRVHGQPTTSKNAFTAHPPYANDQCKHLHTIPLKEWYIQ